MGTLYSSLDSAGMETNQITQLLGRLLFLWFGDDASMWKDNAFENWLAEHTTNENLAEKLNELFNVVNSPEADNLLHTTPKAWTLPEEYKEFRYINGNLFNGPLDVPELSDNFRKQLLEACNFDWSIISPAIFGSMFQTVKSTEARRSLGEHYTTEENIFKVLRPLFLDDLEAKLEAAWNNKSELTKFRNRLGEIRILDPACGCGNFLVVAYRELRALEQRALMRRTELDLQSPDQGHQISWQLGDDMQDTVVKMSNFSGIEINEWPATIADVALLLVDHLANQNFATQFGTSLIRLPIDNRNRANIVHGNALRTDWAEVVDCTKTTYIVGNPPFLGYSRLGKEQKEDRELVFGGKGGVLDFVCCWFRKAADLMETYPQLEATFVSTNSICQGQQVTPLWKPTFDSGVVINFAHRTFRWSSESPKDAQVFCIIVGFSKSNRKNKLIWEYNLGRGASPLGTAVEVKQINGYLTDAPPVFIERRSAPISDVPVMYRGNQPTDGGQLLFDQNKLDEFLKREPQAKPYIRKFSMGQEFIQGIDRYCLWLANLDAAQVDELPKSIRERVENVREIRLQSTKAATRQKAETPWLFDEIRYHGEGTYIGIPKVSSEKRKYIPIDFVSDGMIPGDKLYFIPTDSLFVLGILMSQTHHAWMRQVCGRQKSDYSYGNTTVYNNFVWPKASTQVQNEIEGLAAEVLRTREQYRDTSLAEIYDPRNEAKYLELYESHLKLDLAVERAYGIRAYGDETKITAHLFRLLADREMK